MSSISQLKKSKNTKAHTQHFTYKSRKKKSLGNKVYKDPVINTLKNKSAFQY